MLLARHEYPYRIRRRTSDEPGVVSELVKLGHDIQEDLAAAQAWVTAESSRMGKLYCSVLRSIDATVSQACKEAWDAGPVNEPKQTNLGAWGPASPHDFIGEFQDRVAWRFGLRRAVPTRFVVPRTVQASRSAVQSWSRTARQRRPQTTPPAKPAP